MASMSCRSGDALSIARLLYPATDGMPPRRKDSPASETDAEGSFYH
jgi:hypothetical protein